MYIRIQHKSMKQLLLLSVSLFVFISCENAEESNNSSKQQEQSSQNRHEADAFTEEPKDSINTHQIGKKGETTLAKGVPLVRAKELYQQMCQACHGANGEGPVAPDLTDDKGISAANRAEIANVIYSGVYRKGMPSYKLQCTEEEIYGLADYILLLRSK